MTDTDDPGDGTETRPAAKVNVPGFTVLGHLGEGAMGTVYLAEDATLRRRVAIKLVSSRLAADPEARLRFLREARAMASVEHPHVVRIYGFGENDETPYIVMELIEGDSLRDRIALRGKLPAPEALDITEQVAQGLEAAAARGIVHRDIKPSNVLFDRAGRARVADFGLARPVSGADSSLTGTGAFVGTPHYVSPEQARGEPLDHRSDIYALGIVLYEMLTGEKPFPGSTPVMVVGKHLHEPLPSLPAGRPELPEGVVALVERMTCKEPAGRPASYAALRESLEALIADPARARPRRLGRAARLAAGAAVLGTLGLVAVLGFKLIPGIGKAPTPIQIEKLTDRGTVRDAVLSRDGRYLAYLSDGLWVKDLREKAETRITLPSGGSPDQLNGISSDGSYIFYSDSAQRLFRVPLFGGAPQLVAERPLALSPDGNRVLYQAETGVSVSKADGTGGSQISSGEAGAVAWAADGKRVLILKAGALYEVDLAGGSEEKRADLSGLATDDAHMSLRPSGEVLALAVKKPGERGARLYAVNLRSGTRRPLGEDWFGIGSLAWLPDGDTLVVGGTAPDKPGLGGIWLVSYPDGARKAVPGGYNLKGITADGAGIVGEQTGERSEIRVSTADNPSGFKRIAIGTALFSLCWTPGGEIVYSSKEAGTFDLYVLSPDFQVRRQLTFDRSGAEVDPTASPDGRYVVFTGGRGDGTSLWRVSMDGTGLVKLATMPARQQPWNQPQVSWDSKWVLYFEGRVPDGGSTLKRVSIDGGTPLTIKGSREGAPRPREFAFSGGWSRSGQEVAFLYFTNPAEGGQTPVELAVSSLEGTITRRFPYTPNKLSMTWEHQLVQWSAEGPDRHLYFLRDGQVWKQPVAGGAPTQVTHFEEGVFDFDWSPDGKRLVCSCESSMSDIVLITGFR